MLKNLAYQDLPSPDDFELLMRKAQTEEPLAIAGLLEHWYPDLRRYAQRHLLRRGRRARDLVGGDASI